MTGRLERLLASALATGSAAGAAVVIALGAARPRAGLWLGLGAVVATLAGVTTRRLAVALTAVVALGAQYAVALLGRDGLDPDAAVVSGLLAGMIEAIDWAVERNDGGRTAVEVVVRRAVRVAAWGVAGWLVGVAVVVAASGDVDAILARAAAVGVLVVVGGVIVDRMRPG